MSVYEAGRYPFLREEITAIGEAVRSGMPTVGVCLGSQLLATALGAAVKPNPSGKEVGWGSVRKTPTARRDRRLEQPKNMYSFCTPSQTPAQLTITFVLDRNKCYFYSVASGGIES